MHEIKIRRISTALSAYDVYCLFEGKDHLFLDSSKIGPELGRYSIIGIHPFRKIIYNEGKLQVDGIIEDRNPFDALKQVIDENKVGSVEDMPFLGGGIGYFSYDLGLDEMGVTSNKRQLIKLPDLYFLFYDNLIVFDHINNEVVVTALGKLQDGEESMDAICRKIQTGSPRLRGTTRCVDQNMTSPFTKEAYMEQVEAMRSHIQKGDIYIANMTHTFEGTTNRKLSDLYRVLRDVNPAPFSAFIPLQDGAVLCSSPERFLQIRKGKVTTRPIKGTRPRGANEAEDLAFRKELEASEKDKSELLMIVDLERNDLSRVCEPFSVKVRELFKTEAYATVFHLIADIEGSLKPGYTAVDCIRACFPGGSITGAPKKRAMEIIDDLEAARRGLYTGSIAYLGFDGNADLNIIIRTLVCKGKKVTLGVGGGITWESEPEFEYEETLAKAKALFKALETTDI